MAKFNFSDITLDIIDINVFGEAEMVIVPTNITFSKRVLDDLNYPTTVQFAVDAEHKVFAIRPCKKNEAKAALFSKPKEEQKKGLVSKNVTLRKAITTLIDNYEKNGKYVVTGEYDSENRVMFFDMNDVIKEEKVTCKE